MKMTKQAHRWIGLQNGVFYILLLVMLGLLGFLGYTFKFEADWTYGGRNSLSQPTQLLLKTLDKPLTFIAYIPNRPDLEADLRKMIVKYQRIKKDTSIEFVNPDLDPARAKQDGIQSAGQLAIHLGDKSEVVDGIGEQVVANALQRMSRGAERLVITVEGNGERNLLATDDHGMSQLVATLQRSGFKIQPHNLLRTQSIPDNASFVILASPQQDLLAGEVEILRKYVEKGGNLLWLQDPGGLHGLQTLEEYLGLKIYEGTVIDANQSLQALLGINHPAIVPVIDYANSPITQKLEGSQTIFPFATMVVRDPQAAEKQGVLVWKTEDLLTTLPSSWLEASGVIQGAVKYDKANGDIEGPISLGVSLTRELEKSSDSTTKPHQQRIAVIGDSDFLGNAFIGQGANLELATSLFNWLSVDDNLIQIPIIRAPDTQLQLSEIKGYIMGIFFLFVLPLLLIASGTWIWWRRRKQ